LLQRETPAVSYYTSPWAGTAGAACECGVGWVVRVKRRGFDFGVNLFEV
jgi:hypothetical protein